MATSKSMARTGLVKIAGLALGCLAFFGRSFAFDTSECVEKTFVVTAYYSPETGQAFYYKKNVQEEKILNGEGKLGASWKKVFNGMLAWPATYDFGTVIYFPGRGIGEVADRGGAIVDNGIDIWMGKGEEWLIRALIFWKKTLSWFVCINPPNPPLPSEAGLKSRGTDYVLGFDRDRVPILKNFFDLSVRIQQLEKWRNDIWTWTLQKYLVKLGYLNKKYQNGNYDTHTKRAVCNYQVKKWIVKRNHPDCGKFGKVTRYSMKTTVEKKALLPQDLWATSSFADIINLAENYFPHPLTPSKDYSPNPSPARLDWSKIEGNSKNIFQFYRPYTKNQQNSEIKILQTFLQGEKLFSGKVDGIYSQKVIGAVFDFQKKYGILSDASDASLKWYLGPTTRKKMNEIRNK